MATVTAPLLAANLSFMSFKMIIIATMKKRNFFSIYNTQEAYSCFTFGKVKTFGLV